MFVLVESYIVSHNFFKTTHKSLFLHSYIQPLRVGLCVYGPREITLEIDMIQTPHSGYVTLCYFNHCQHKNHVTMLYHVIDSK